MPISRSITDEEFVRLNPDHPKTKKLLKEKPELVKTATVRESRTSPCVELGPCPKNRKCSEGIRTCLIGLFGEEVKHAEQCQTCEAYVAKS